MIRYAEFCAGIGGFRLGIEQSDLDAISVYINEINVSCELTYSENFNTKFNSKDLFDINVDSLPDFEYVVFRISLPTIFTIRKREGIR